MYMVALVVICMTLTAGAQTKAKVLTADPMTGLPLHPATDPGTGFGNKPDELPDSNVCKSKMQGEFYSLYRTTTDAAETWYTQNLKGFKMEKGSGSGSPQVVFYKPDGTLLVIVRGSKGTPAAFSVAYERFTPGLSEKTIASVTTGNVVCP